MKIPPDFIITTEILKLLSQIESLRLLFKSLPIKTELKNKIERVSLLKSSLYSARIEGNPLTFEQVKDPYLSKNNKKIEVFNILYAIKYLDSYVQSGSFLDLSLILKLHSIVMKDLSASSGFFRTEPGAIFNQAGVAVYVAPDPLKIKELIEQLLTYSNSTSDFPVLQALITHLCFEKIHPYEDGNGRIGRLLIWAILKSKGYDFPAFIPIEEYIDNNRNSYYFHLDQGMKETEEYLKFMLEAFEIEAEKIKDEILNDTNQDTDIILPPRQEEIFAIIKDHLNVSFDFISRRFYKVPARTLRYDLKKLAEKGQIVKVGKTRGSFYRVKKMY